MRFRRTKTNVIETGRDRRELADDAGLGHISVLSAVAGTLVAYGAFAILLALAAMVAAATGLDTDISGDEGRTLGAGGAATMALVLFAAYWFGGYVAGRMARRSGLAHGVAVFVTSLLIGAAVAAGVALLADADANAVQDSLRSVGLPTSGESWRDIGLVAGAVALVAMLLGCLVGGASGERWHEKLLRRALDPDVGATARERELAEQHRVRADERDETSHTRVERATGGRRTVDLGDDARTPEGESASERERVR